MVFNAEDVSIIADMERSSGVKMVNSRAKLSNQFDVIRKLGQGTYGKVHLALNKDTGQQVAIKTIKKKAIESEADLVSIQREIQLMSSVQHPNIIHIYEVLENREKIVLVMEYCSGGELYDYLSYRKVFEEDVARKFFRQIAAAVYYCHKNMICHRDLKLENVLLDDKGNAKMADFGLSNIFDEKNFLRTFCGSPLYASPEMVQGKPYYGPEVDCWSLGVLLYTLVYGAMPFDGSNFKTLVKQIAEGEYFEPKKTSGASELIKRMLTVAPAKRATIDDICEDTWVNFGAEVPLSQVAQEFCERLPVRLDFLLSLGAATAEVPLGSEEEEDEPSLSLGDSDRNLDRNEGIVSSESDLSTINEVPADSPLPEEVLEPEDSEQPNLDEFPRTLDSGSYLVIDESPVERKSSVTLEISDALLGSVEETENVPENIEESSENNLLVQAEEVGTGEKQGTETEEKESDEFSESLKEEVPNSKIEDLVPELFEGGKAELIAEESLKEIESDIHKVEENLEEAKMSEETGTKSSIEGASESPCFDVKAEENLSEEKSIKNMEEKAFEKVDLTLEPFGTKDAEVEPEGQLVPDIIVPDVESVSEDLSSKVHISKEHGVKSSEIESELEPTKLTDVGKAVGDETKGLHEVPTETKFLEEINMQSSENKPGIESTEVPVDKDAIVNEESKAEIVEEKSIKSSGIKPEGESFEVPTNVINDITEKSNKTIEKSEEVLEKSEIVQEEVLEKLNEVLEKSEEVLEKLDEVLEKSEEVLEKSEEVLEKSEEVLEKLDEVLEKSEEVLEKSEEVLEKSEEVLEKSEEVLEKSEEKSEIVQEKQEIVQEAVLEKLDKVLEKSEEVLEKSEEVLEKSEIIQEAVLEQSAEVLKESEIVQEKSEIVQEAVLEKLDKVLEKSEAVLEKSEEVLEKSVVIQEESEVLEKSKKVLEKSDSIIEKSKKVLEKSKNSFEESIRTSEVKPEVSSSEVQVSKSEHVGISEKTVKKSEKSEKFFKRSESSFEKSSVEISNGTSSSGPSSPHLGSSRGTGTKKKDSKSVVTDEANEAEPAGYSVIRSKFRKLRKFGSIEEREYLESVLEPEIKHCDSFSSSGSNEDFDDFFDSLNSDALFSNMLDHTKKLMKKIGTGSVELSSRSSSAMSRQFSRSSSREHSFRSSVWNRSSGLDDFMKNQEKVLNQHFSFSNNSFSSKNAFEGSSKFSSNSYSSVDSFDSSRKFSRNFSPTFERLSPTLNRPPRTRTVDLALYDQVPESFRRQNSSGSPQMRRFDRNLERGSSAEDHWSQKGPKSIATSRFMDLSESWNLPSSRPNSRGRTDMNSFMDSLDDPEQVLQKAKELCSSFKKKK